MNVGVGNCRREAAGHDDCVVMGDDSDLFECSAMHLCLTISFVNRDDDLEDLTYLPVEIVLREATRVHHLGNFLVKSTILGSF